MADYRTSTSGDRGGGSRRETAAKAPSWRGWRIEHSAVVPRHVDGIYARLQRPVGRGDGKGFGGEIPCQRQQVERARRGQFLNELAAETPRAAAPSSS